ncbi:MAG TPA: DUF6596 domain-containing protein [Puia sp.]|nr:DUF6596 domain-containing protein [Puia sp.]
MSIASGSSYCSTAERRAGMNPAEVEMRLPAVLTTIYLLFTEGYYRRSELCWEAMRLCRMLIDNPLTDRPAVNALLVLIYTGIDDERAGQCFQHAASLAKSEADKQALLKKIGQLGR